MSNPSKPSKKLLTALLHLFGFTPHAAPPDHTVSAKERNKWEFLHVPDFGTVVACVDSGSIRVMGALCEEDTTSEFFSVTNAQELSALLFQLGWQRHDRATRKALDDVNTTKDF